MSLEHDDPPDADFADNFGEHPSYAPRPRHSAGPANSEPDPRPRAEFTGSHATVADDDRDDSDEEDDEIIESTRSAADSARREKLELLGSIATLLLAAIAGVIAYSTSPTVHNFINDAATGIAVDIRERASGTKEQRLDLERQARALGALILASPGNSSHPGFVDEKQRFESTSAVLLAHGSFLASKGQFAAAVAHLETTITHFRKCIVAIPPPDGPFQSEQILRAMRTCNDELETFRERTRHSDGRADLPT